MKKPNRVTRRLNHRQAEFARRIAKGQSQSHAYRYVYNPKAGVKMAAEEGCRIAAHPRVREEVARLRAKSEVKVLLTINDQLEILAKGAQVAGTAPALINARARSLDVYAKIAGTMAPLRQEVSGPGGGPVPIQAAVAVTRMSVKDKIEMMKRAREQEKAVETASR